MSAAFKCDRCGETRDGAASLTLTLTSGLKVDLCGSCEHNFFSFMDRKPVNVLQPKTEQSEKIDAQAYMKRMHDSVQEQSKNAYANKYLSCGRCWQHGFERVHGLMEVCPFHNK